MKKCIFNILLSVGALFAYNYDVGEFISEAHQNVTKETCYEGNGYEVNDDWKLSEWNGVTNGGHYNVIFIDMSATW